MSKKLAHQATGLRRRIKGRQSVSSMKLLAKTKRLVVISVFPARQIFLAVKKRFQLRGSSWSALLYRRATAVMLNSCEAFSIPSQSDKLVVPLLGKAKTWVGLTVDEFILPTVVLDASCPNRVHLEAILRDALRKGRPAPAHDSRRLRTLLCRREAAQALSP